jgi:hypothetical protein
LLRDLKRRPRPTQGCRADYDDDDDDDDTFKGLHVSTYIIHPQALSIKL